ncbi:MAG: YjjG family noncanonical pyrimidine nucleotidase [Mucilaginibacter sp.]
MNTNSEIPYPKSEIRKYRHIFFDLDHTIWDFDKNAEETLHELYVTHKLNDIGLHSPEVFIETYTRNNHKLWAQYHVGEITKDYLREARFRTTFLELGVHPDVMPAGFEDEYVRLCPTKTNLFPDAHEVLAYLKAKYVLHLISNGFKESSEIKIAGSNIGDYFDQIIISENVGVNKPDPKIFQHALEVSGAKKEESLMIGDSIEADVRGALSFGMDAIFFNALGVDKPNDVPVQISGLKELMEIL